jgi:hypothetical protein
MAAAGSCGGTRVNGILRAGWLALLLGAAICAAGPVRAAALPKPQHVFIIILENEGFDETFGAGSPATYLKTLAKRGALLENYYGIGHFSLDNYIALISGQGPNPATQADCQTFTPFVQTGTAADGQAVGTGCVYPASVQTIAGQLAAKGLTWKAYMQDMGNILPREAATCGHPAIGAKDNTQKAVVGDEYATRHDPFVYFAGIIDSPACKQNVVSFATLKGDLETVATTPNYVFITPNLCNDGHDGGEDGRKCVDGAPGGLVSADKFLSETVPMILASPAYKQNGLLIITFDEADIDVKIDKTAHKITLGIADAAACCGEPGGPNIPPGATIFGSLKDTGPGIAGPGGGRIGAVLVSRYIAPGTVTAAGYNHYALLRSVEDFFGLDHLGYAGQAQVRPFGADVFTRPGA